MVSPRFDRVRRDKLIDALTLGEVVQRLALYDTEDVKALAVIAKNVLKRRLNEHDELLRQKSTRQPHHRVADR